MTKRRAAWAVVAASGLLLVALVVRQWYPLPQHHITEANYQRIKNGMSQDEVEAIFNAWPGDYSGGIYYYPGEENYYLEEDGTISGIWMTDKWWIEVFFDPRDGTVVGKAIDQPVILKPGLLVRLRAILGL